MNSKRKKETKLQAALTESGVPPQEELERIYRQHHGLVIQTAYRLIGNVSDAEDVLHTVFIRMLRKGSPPNRSEKLGSYLRRAAVNAAIDLIRARAGQRKVAWDDLQQCLADDSSQQPDQLQREKELKNWLRDAIAKLSPQAAEIFALRYLEGYRNQEIAELVGTSPGVVAVVLHRSRQRLRDEMRSILGEEDEQAKGPGEYSG